MSEQGMSRAVAGAEASAISALRQTITNTVRLVVSPAGPPEWSGMDVRDYAGSLPADTGALIGYVPLASALWIDGTGSAYRIHYSTMNQHGQVATSTGAVFLPDGAAPHDGWPVLAWAHGTVGLADFCTPSAQPRLQRDSDYLSHWLSCGYAVVATDYVGLGTPGMLSYLNGRVTAHSIVDSVKALHGLAEEADDVRVAKRWAIVGQSQGAAAALNSARLATELCSGSGLEYRGVVATGTPAYSEYFMLLGGPALPPIPLPTQFSAYACFLLAAFIESRPDLQVEKILSPHGHHIVEQAQKLCYPAMRKRIRGQRLCKIFAAPVLSIPGIRKALAEYMSVPVKGYDRPIFLGHGLLDVDVPITLVLALYLRLKLRRQPVQIHIYPLRDHSGAMYAALPDVEKFLADILR
ncbi:hypothetical protein GOEFS_106_00020 [Gordonia effusa NBRC 100432]|uniref:Peptidase S9 prolyl oligopeptidase catalytic domain-containing protein n=1 Tax=Gordonia effusa NBRC 100432 TaxID=1077974 RepID=H0R4V5_9ACTN|nr:lipase family protein [Gordonia effusa]GAB20106.1 hypothetical protein GOEFS_106_00020 [Gordonia effusa NBRC 100432]